jgi:hypothetical protein
VHIEPGDLSDAKVADRLTSLLDGSFCCLPQDSVLDPTNSTIL